MIAWVETLGYEEAGDRLKEVYDEASSQIGEIHNLYRAHSLRPDTIDGSDRLYKAVLHCADNTLAPWLGELVATYVAALNDCHYAFVNHGANFLPSSRRPGTCRAHHGSAAGWDTGERAG